MPHLHMSFQRPLAVSLGIHVLILGTALAFAQYAGGLFRSEGTIITVSLTGGVDGGGAARRNISRTVPNLQADAIAPTLAVPASELFMPAEVNAGDAGLPAAGREGGGTVEGGQGEGTSSAAASGTDGDAVAFSPEQWLLLQSAIEQVKTYPRLARERGIEGTVLVRFKVLPSGMVETVNVVRSSGAEILDEASVRTVFRAAPIPYVNGWVEVPMSYVLK